MSPQVTTSRGRIEPPSEGFCLVKMTQLVGAGGGAAVVGVNLEVCSPDVTFKTHSACHSWALQVAFGSSGATPTAAAKQCYLKLPQGQLL